MIKALKQFFDDQLSQKEDDHPQEHALQIAAAALLFEVSRSDHSVKPEQRESIIGLVKKQFNLSEEEATVLLDLAEQEVHDATSLHGFVTLINENWSQQQRLELVEYMWRVAYSDQKLNDHEVHLMRKVQRLLYIPHKQFIGAKLKAKKSS
ncbi:MAG: TerB family tellurite resistance protein [Arenicellales bacterium]|nr:TerB family tellurite resistance protein [Arenicellales bacterium]